MLSLNIDAEKLKSKNLINQRIKPNFNLINETNNLQIQFNKTNIIPEIMVNKFMKNNYPLNALDQIERNIIYRNSVKLSRLWEENDLNKRIFQINPIEWEFTLTDKNREV